MKKKLVVAMLSGCMVLGGASQVMAAQSAAVTGEADVVIDDAESDAQVSGAIAVTDDCSTIALAGQAVVDDSSIGAEAYAVLEDDGSVSLYCGLASDDADEEWFKVSLTGVDAAAVVPEDSSDLTLTADDLEGFTNEGTEEIDGTEYDVYTYEATYDDIAAMAEAAGEDVDTLAAEIADEASAESGTEISADLAEAILEGLDLYVEVGVNTETQELAVVTLDLSGTDWSAAADLLGVSFDMPVLDFSIVLNAAEDTDLAVPDEALATENVIELSADDLAAMLQ